MRLLGHAVKEATMFIQPWMRLLGHAVKEATMFRAMDAIARPCLKEATMFIEPWM